MSSASIKDALVAFKQKPAKVLSGGEKIEIRLQDGSTKSVRPKDVTFIHPGPVASLDFPELDAAIDDTIEMLTGESLPFTDFCELLYGSYAPAQAWNAYAILTAGRYFQGDMESITARDRDAIDAEIRAENEKSEGRRRRAEFLDKVRAGKLESADFQYMRDVEHLALGKSENSGIMRELGMEQTMEKAHRLLLSTGVWDCWTNPYPSRAAIPPENPDFPIPELPTEERLDLREQSCFAIDDEGNQDPDDAIAFHDGLLWVHVADVAALVVPGSDLDLEAMARGSNLYLPERIIHMLPPELTSVLGLGLKPESPALSFGIKIDDDGNVELKHIKCSTICVKRLSYAQAETMLDSPELSPIYAETQKFRRLRIQRGATSLNLPEVKIKVVDQQVLISPLPRLESREMVADAMMAAGEALARYAVANNIPMPFASQPKVPELSGQESYSAMIAARRNFSPTSTSIIPDPHSGLGLDPYVRVTSPLRRYCDLLAHQQLRAHLAGLPLIDSESLDARIAAAEQAAFNVRKTERIANEYWKLVFLSLNPEWRGEAIAVDYNNDRNTFLIPGLAYEFKSRYGGKVAPDSVFEAGIVAVDLPALTARFSLTPKDP